ncbi:MAG: hypothetical protein ACRED0_09860 [Gammaproteobacteria bacterium]
MQLQGRDLHIETQGEDVALLHRELIHLGFQIPRDEIERLLFGPGTRKIVLEFQSRYPNEHLARGVVDQRTAELINAEVDASQPRFIVQGQIRQQDGNVVPGAPVRALDIDLRNEELLGEAVADQDGRYKITYSAKRFQRAEKRSADLKVRVFSPEILLPIGPPPQPVLLAESPVIFNANEVETVDLIVSVNAPGLPSEVDQIIRELTPLLENVRPEGIPDPEFIDKIADLKADEIDFLTGETGIERQKLAFFVTAATLQKWSHTQDSNIPTAIFYGLAREGLPLDLPALYREGPQRQRPALQQAIDDNIIPAPDRQSLDQVLENLQRLLVRHVLQTKPAPESHSLSDLLYQSVLPPEKHVSLLNLYVNHVGTIEEFWQKLPEHPEFQDAVLVRNVQFTFQLGALTQNHVPLIQALRERYQPSSTRKLVELDTAAWTELIDMLVDGRTVGVPNEVPGATPDEKKSNYVTGMISILQAAFPTDTIAYLVPKLPETHFGAAGTKQGVARFFTNAISPQLLVRNFDIRSTRIDDFIEQDADNVFEGIPIEERAQVVTHVKRTQRLYALSTSAETLSALLGTGLESAYAIANVPHAAFVNGYQDQLGGPQVASMIISARSIFMPPI